MRYLVPAVILLLSACATAPETETPMPTLPVTPSTHVYSSVLGLTSAELIAQLGSPALQVREGVGLKMQFRRPQCIFDAYLYPPPSGQGVTRVAHSDARLPSGADTDQAACISAIRATR
ncbi:hypothetical protein H9L13_02345 [Sphingomonas lutea]|uniref:Uncharacterized protein n=1 Tax=Sphingomonas lutea TaxID=1045317 RepID=A0A7G9SIW8_9SPHN|nr:hypothetical protein [Sphingomonas lutea]QNN67793.1 hypothetical protein H9L13_02345 [Sphingomonas lutea]